MSEIRNGQVIIYAEKPQQCDECGEIKELRPYGPPGKTMLCFECAMKDEAGTKARFMSLLDGG